mmetsp:Transcript_70473/g.199870  ORF Transcript_70473/g.199870 Transcript_70473/m.199870 type:complete len:277 (-) Transcript_70473:69-899(-)
MSVSPGKILLAIRCTTPGRVIPIAKICVDDKVRLRDVLSAWAEGAMKSKDGEIPDGVQVKGSFSGAGLDLDAALRMLRPMLPVREGRLTVSVVWPKVEDVAPPAASPKTGGGGLERTPSREVLERGRSRELLEKAKSKPQPAKSKESAQAKATRKKAEKERQKRKDKQKKEKKKLKAETKKDKKAEKKKKKKEAKDAKKPKASAEEGANGKENQTMNSPGKEKKDTSNGNGKAASGSSNSSSSSSSSDDSEDIINQAFEKYLKDSDDEKVENDKSP